MIERAIAGVAGRDRELELRLEAVRLMAIFMSPRADSAGAGRGRAVRRLEGRTAGRMRAAAARRHPPAPARRARRPRSPSRSSGPSPIRSCVAAIGPESAWLDFVIGGLVQDRPARRRAPHAWRSRSPRRSAAARRPGSPRRRCGARGSRCARERPPAAEADAARGLRGSCRPAMWQHVWCASCLDARCWSSAAQLDEAQAVLDGGGRRGRDRVRSARRVLLSTRSILRAAQGDAARRAGGPARGARRRGDGTRRPIRTSTAGSGSPACSTRPGTRRPPRGRPSGARVGARVGHAGLHRPGADRLRARHRRRRRASRDCATRSRSSSARPRAASSPASLVELGAALRRRGERVAAREPLRRALDIAAAGGLVATAERAREELRVTGAKVRRPESTGLESLTPSERRIVDLAAGGASNPEIAQALFVTVKTVEMHLGNAYRKLEISSRRQLAPLLPPLKALGSEYRDHPVAVRRAGRDDRGDPTRRARCTMFARLTVYENVDLDLADQVKQWIEALGRRPVRRTARLPRLDDARRPRQRAARRHRLLRERRPGAQEADALLGAMHEQARDRGARGDPAGARHAARERRPLRDRPPRLKRHVPLVLDHAIRFGEVPEQRDQSRGEAPATVAPGDTRASDRRFRGADARRRHCSLQRRGYDLEVRPRAGGRPAARLVPAARRSTARARGKSRSSSPSAANSPNRQQLI